MSSWSLRIPTVYGIRLFVKIAETTIWNLMENLNDLRRHLVSKDSQESNGWAVYTGDPTGQRLSRSSSISKEGTRHPSLQRRARSNAMMEEGSQPKQHRKRSSFFMGDSDRSGAHPKQRLALAKLWLQSQKYARHTGMSSPQPMSLLRVAAPAPDAPWALFKSHSPPPTSRPSTSAWTSS